jgi:hypothetical protein
VNYLNNMTPKKLELFNVQLVLVTQRHSLRMVNYSCGDSMFMGNLELEIRNLGLNLSELKEISLEITFKDW